MAYNFKNIDAWKLLIEARNLDWRFETFDKGKMIPN